MGEIGIIDLGIRFQKVPDGAFGPLRPLTLTKIKWRLTPTPDVRMLALSTAKPIKRTRAPPIAR